MASDGWKKTPMRNGARKFFDRRYRIGKVCHSYLVFLPICTNTQIQALSAPPLHRPCPLLPQRIRCSQASRVFRQARKLAHHRRPPIPIDILPIIPLRMAPLLQPTHSMLITGATIYASGLFTPHSLHFPPSHPATGQARRPRREARKLWPKLSLGVPCEPPACPVFQHQVTTSGLSRVVGKYRRFNRALLRPSLSLLLGFSVLISGRSGLRHSLTPLVLATTDCSSLTR